ncbi:MAG: dipeptidase [Anaerolineae bacterium]|uniref:dipeptidase n=1 Tax=Promineifilum sp. TaxID=2664178 RepID=UPI001D86E432|nr:dipeptidase [Anaerolineales bacterium]MCB8936501.1 dipeptidase [Promineifilum sp.]MCO5180222.1 dipeptidase [Promineifilum sp.]MCW5846062.1 dipeptidase [Anaerolineae bacterium]
MSDLSEAARQYARQNAERFRHELIEMLRIPSLSGDPAHAGDIRRMAEWLESHMRDLGLDNVQIMPTAGHPVVYGEWLGAGPSRPTVLVYGHYDVVPALMEDGWHTDPFEPTEKDGKIYARGATDDKGQLFIHVKALESYLKTAGRAPVNVKILLEGEEEISSPNLVPFIEEHLDLLAADVCVISDSSMRSIDEPAILHSLRGMTYMEIEIHGPSDDLHSGLWGGAVHNPALALVEILGKLYNPDHTIAVPGFYDDVVPLTDEERAMIAKTDLTEEQYKSSTGVPAIWGDADYNIRERISARPTLDINGLWSGWAGPGPKTIVPAKAGAKISSRLVGNQDPHKIFELFKDYIDSLAPPTVQVELKLITTGKPALFPFDIPEMQAASRAYEKGWGAEPVFTRGGGSIPVVAEIAALMNIPVVMMGYGLDDDGLHSPNERYSIEMFERGIETAIVYLDELAQSSL